MMTFEAKLGRARKLRSAFPNGKFLTHDIALFKRQGRPEAGFTAGRDACAIFPGLASSEKPNK